MPQRPEIVRTDAVVLHSMEYGETSRILNLLTRKKGRIGVIVKGARTPTTRFGTTLDPMAYIEAVIHIKPGRSLQLLTETAHVRTFPVLRESLDRIETGLKIVELARAMVEEGQTNAPLFSLLVSSLTALNGVEYRASNLWPFFQLRCATVLGFEPSFESHAVRELESDSGILELETGRIVGLEEADPSAGRSRVRASRQALRAFAVLARADLTDVLRMSMKPDQLREVESLIASYMKYHVEEAYPSRSAQVFAQFGS